ncbi:hypothetical protein [Kitasatospora sp. CB01950]|uniref:hypothetical protein n=1 Tax=Kitasatospora sp. CB01950 TaxID=1703930 RepID=UPI0009395BAC|nr:hypothetical protein [Kitasatospora sp. CB01950]OKJ06618.1 hypothetical protein AMK19_22180 [Kitasatospora sp. CB01950]
MTAVARPPAQRGSEQIADRVYRRIAARAAADALAPAWRGRLDPMPQPKVSALYAHGRVRLTLHVELPFPCDVAALARTVRDAACERVVELTGTPVVSAEVIVDGLHPAGLR